MAGKRIRHIKRYREIAMALMSQGFGYIVEELDLLQKIPFSGYFFTSDSEKPIKTLGERIRLVLEQLGPTYIKLGQIASTRSDLFPPNIIKELEKLQDDAPSFPYHHARQILEQELQTNLTAVFKHFESTPLAAASIGQVYYAVLASGEKVAVKVQRPDISVMIETDLEILYNLVSLAERRFKVAENYPLTEMLDEFAKSLRNELDYTIEARNAKKITQHPGVPPYFYIPQVYWNYSTQKVLTTEYIEGLKINELESLQQQGHDLPHLAESFVKGILHQIFIGGYFHCDPHPGNVIVLADQSIALIDFGMIGRLSSELRYHFASLIISLMQKDPDGVVKAVLEMGIAPDQVERSQLKDDIEQLTELYFDLPLSQLHLGDAFRHLSEVIFKHQIKIPPVLTLVGKTLLTVEGITQKLDPSLNMVTIAEPFGRQLLVERLHPKNWLFSLWRNVHQFGDIMIRFPHYFKELSVFFKRGRLHLEVSIPEMDIFLKVQERLVNRLSFCIVLLSFSIIMSGLIIGLSFAGQYSALKNPLVEIGFGIVTLMLLWLLASIIRSGGL